MIINDMYVQTSLHAAVICGIFDYVCCIIAKYFYFDVTSLKPHLRHTTRADGLRK